MLKLQLFADAHKLKFNYRVQDDNITGRQRRNCLKQKRKLGKEKNIILLKKKMQGALLTPFFVVHILNG